MANIFLMDIKRVRTANSSQTKVLSTLPQPVDELFYIGSLLELLQKPCVAIVGSRKVSSYGRIVTEKLARELVKAGVVIISGMALGVDSIAHQAAIDAGGTTIAVLPSELDRPYPGQHHQLARQIVQQGGALASEYPAGQGPPMKHQFIARNRIIAALSQEVVITEAAVKSGSLHTAQFALEQGIDVFAVPGNITSPGSAGTNNLIKQGAIPVTQAEDILSALGIEASQTQLSLPTNPAQQAIIAALQAGPTNTSTLLVQTKLNSAVLQQTITTLELDGIIYSHDGSTWMLSS